MASTRDFLGILRCERKQLKPLRSQLWDRRFNRFMRQTKTRDPRLLHEIRVLKSWPSMPFSVMNNMTIPECMEVFVHQQMNLPIGQTMYYSGFFDGKDFPFIVFRRGEHWVLIVYNDGEIKSFTVSHGEDAIMFLCP